MTQNLGLLMGSKIAQEIDLGKVQVDERQLYMANITNSVLVTNKLVVQELLPSKDCHNKKIVLGRSMQERHDTDINELLAINQKKGKDLLANVIQIALNKGEKKTEALPEMGDVDDETKKKMAIKRKQE